MSKPNVVPRAEHQRRWETYVANNRNAKATAALLGMSYSAFRDWRMRILATFAAANENPEKGPSKSWWKSYIALDPLTVETVAPTEGAIKPDRDAVRDERARQENLRLRRERDKAMEEAIEAQDFSRALMGLVEQPLEPINFQPEMPNPGGPSPETVVVFLSDLHWGEVVDIAAVDGVNSYNLDIARARLERCFQAILDLSTKHWAGPPPARLILILGGDMVSGEIHDELKKTNALMALPAVRDVVTYLRAGIQLLHDNLDCPIDIISLPGNHGRATFKPESKLNSETSYDTLVCEFLEMQMKSAGNERLTFYTPVSNDAVFSVYGWKFLATHGDKIGTGGGRGFVGVAAPAARGMKKLIGDYAARGEHIDVILMGHFHTPLKLEEGYVNGSLIGQSEYGRDGRFRPTPAQQLFLAIHPRRCVSQYRYINVGSADEGSIYERPEPPTEMRRPRYRVRATTTRT